VLAKLIFFAVAATAACGSAAIAGLIAVVVGLSIHLPTAILITWGAGAAAVTFGAAVTVASMAVSLFFGVQESPTAKRLKDEQQLSSGEPTHAQCRFLQPHVGQVDGGQGGDGLAVGQVQVPVGDGHAGVAEQLGADHDADADADADAARHIPG
jgi:hypothetical protein